MRKQHFDVTGMSCAACSARVDKAVRGLDGVEEVAVNLLKNDMTVQYDESALTEEAICQAVAKAGYAAIPERRSAPGAKAKAEPKRDIAKEEYLKMKKRLVSSIVFTVPVFYISMGHMMGWPLPPCFHGMENSMILALTLFILTIPVLFINRKFFINGFRSLWHRAPNMDSLIALGSSAAVVYGIYALYKIAYAMGRGDLMTAMDFAMDLYFESAAMILTLITLGKFLEARAKGKTSDAITKLMNLAPKTAIVLRDGKELEIPLEELEKGDIAVVRAGASVPADGVILKGGGAVDESAITGESIPSEKAEGSKMTGGTVLKSGYVEMKVQSVGEETTLSGIIRLVDEATSSKAPIAKMADKVSGVFVPVVICIAIITALVWILTGQSFEFALSKAIAVLVISCPCALGLATPTAIMVGTGRGAQNGILIKSAESLENMHDINAVILDKTGTITKGKPEVTDVVGSEDLLSIAASLEKPSEHPLAVAIVEEAGRKGVRLLPVTDFSQTAGMGVSGIINGKSAEGGNRKLLDRHGLYDEKARALEERLADEGKTPLFFIYDGRLIGTIALSDVVKPTSARAIKEMKAMGIRTYIVTGDNTRTAKAIQRMVEADEVIAEVLPADKEKEVAKLQGQGYKVAMVGDGINDAPALARADVGIAIGAGTDIAIESADLVLMRNDLMDVPSAIQLGKATIRNIKQNLMWALLYNSICIPVAAGVLYPAFKIGLSPMIAAFCMSFSSVFVVTNALRLRLFKPKYTTPEPEAEESPAKEEITETQVGEPEGVTMATKTISIEGMMCQHCVKHVTNALKGIPGVSEVTVSLEDNNAVIKADSSVTDEAIKAAITEEGYEVKGIEG